MASFKGGKYIPIASKQDHVSVHKHLVNLLVYSNRYGYVFYATQNEGLAIVSASYIDRESRHLSKSSEDDDHEDANDDPQNQPIGSKTILRRPYIPAGPTNKAPSLIPYWIALNADETILAIVLLQVETSAWFIILYDVVKLIQSVNSLRSVLNLVVQHRFGFFPFRAGELQSTLSTGAFNEGGSR